ncbi:MAG: acetylornithine transaminase [Bacillota bacterium]
MQSQKTIELEQAHIFQTYKRQPVVLVKGEGARVWDADGREYLDFVSGLAVCGLGHCHPAVTRAIAHQAGQLVHTSNLYYTVPQAQLAARLAALTGLDRVFFCNSGAEANEGAIKLARKFGGLSHPDRYHIVCTHGSFHGRTLATLAATGQARYRQGFGPMPPGFRHVPFNDTQELKAAVDRQTAAILVEPVQGEGGVNVANSDFMACLAALREETGVLLIFDEIQCGLGRTGRWFAFEHYGVRPDIITLAKSLAAGVPMGAFCAREEVARALSLGDHGTTFGGNPLATAASLAMLAEMERQGLPDQVTSTGKRLTQGLQELAGRHSMIVEVRGLGLMVACQLAGDGAPLVDACRERGLLVNCTAGNVIRFLPPLVVSPAEVDRALGILDLALGAL